VLAGRLFRRLSFRPRRRETAARPQAGLHPLHRRHRVAQGGAGFANLASPKFGLRAVAQSLARELAPEGIHVAHVIIDGQIRSDQNEHLLQERGPDSLLEPDAIAAQYLHLHQQPPSTWTFELDLRPWTEPF